MLRLDRPAIGGFGGQGLTCIFREPLPPTVAEQLGGFAQTLSDKEDVIFRERLIAEDPLTLQELGDMFGVSRERVRQIEKRLLGRLRRYLEDELPEYFGNIDFS